MMSMDVDGEEGTSVPASSLSPRSIPPSRSPSPHDPHLPAHVPANAAWGAAHYTHGLSGTTLAVSAPPAGLGGLVTGASARPVSGGKKARRRMQSASPVTVLSSTLQDGMFIKSPTSTNGTTTPASTPVSSGTKINVFDFSPEQQRSPDQAQFVHSQQGSPHSPLQQQQQQQHSPGLGSPTRPHQPPCLQQLQTQRSPPSPIRFAPSPLTLQTSSLGRGHAVPSRRVIFGGAVAQPVASTVAQQVPAPDGCGVSDMQQQQQPSAAIACAPRRVEPGVTRNSPFENFTVRREASSPAKNQPIQKRRRPSRLDTVAESDTDNDDDTSDDTSSDGEDGRGRDTQDDAALDSVDPSVLFDQPDRDDDGFLSPQPFLLRSKSVMTFSNQLDHGDELGVNWLNRAPTPTMQSNGRQSPMLFRSKSAVPFDHARAAAGGSRFGWVSPEPMSSVMFSTPETLPTIKGQHADLKSINPETLVRLMQNDFAQHFDQFVIFDCRFPYEFEGGHIQGAVNVCSQADLLELLYGGKLFEHQTTKPVTSRLAVIFHCEFSSQRGPNLCRFLRRHDRKINVYPNLHFPNCFVLDKGYKQFFIEYPGLCDPSQYVTMDSNPELCQKWMAHYRRQKRSNSRPCSVTEHLE